MDDFLLDLGFSNDLIDEIIRINGDNIYANLCFNSEEVTNIINYLKEIGIAPIEELLIYKINIFFEDIESLKNKISKYGTENIVKLINEDFFNIDLLLKED